jgi:D-arabinose 1-dehydrogenase-like Zn-dependent alcohol dehydrogenase
MQDLRDVIALGAAGLVEAHVTPYPLAEFGAAYHALVAGEIIGRAVIVPA